MRESVRVPSCDTRLTLPKLHEPLKNMVRKSEAAV